MPSDASAPYPSQYESDVVLRDGSVVRLRPIRADDVDRWLSFLHRLSTHSKYLRFHHIPREMRPDDAARFCNVDYKDACAVVAELPPEKNREIVAIGRYYRQPDGESAEIALVVDDALHGKGLGTRIIEWLVDVARRNGISRFEADILPENEEMMKVLVDCGFQISSQLEDGVYRVSFPIESIID